MTPTDLKLFNRLIKEAGRNRVMMEFDSSAKYKWSVYVTDSNRIKLAFCEDDSANKCFRSALTELKKRKSK